MLSMLLWLSIVINEVVPAPSSGPEYVELYNPSNTAVDVSGWRIDDDTPGGTTTTIAAGTIIAPFQLLVVPITTAILNNTGDSAVLLDATGKQVDRIDFGAMKDGESMARIPDGSTTIGKTTVSLGQFNVPSTMTPSPTQSATSTPIPTDTTIPPSATATPSSTASNTATIAPSTTATPSTRVIPPQTVTLSPSHTATLSPSHTATLSPSQIPATVIREQTTGIPTISLMTNTRTPSLTKTPSDTRTPSLTKTPSDTRTPSLTKTPSDTRTPSLTKTASPQKKSTPRAIVMHVSQTAVHEEMLRLTLDRQQQPVLVVCVPAPATLAGWHLNDAMPFGADTPRCQHVSLDQTAQFITLYNPHQRSMATIDVATTWCTLDVSACRPSPTAPLDATPLIAHWRPAPVVDISPTQIPRTTASVVPPAPVPPTWPWGSITGGICVVAGVWLHRRVARSDTAVLYYALGDDAESSISGVSSESGSV